MNKHHLHHRRAKFQFFKPWYFLIIAVISGAVCLHALRANSEHMAKLRDAVYSADKNNGDVTGALKNLQAFVTTHMNTDLTSPNGVYPPIQLQYTYDRLVQAQGDQLASSNNVFYTQAQQYCESQIPTGYVIGRISCIEQYLTNHGSINTTLPPIPDDLYKFDFASPVWSPDLAGWSMVIAAVSLVLFVVTWLIRRLAN